jgi:hypothetical protein
MIQKNTVSSFNYEDAAPAEFVVRETCSHGASPALSEAKCFTAQSAVLRACDAAKLCAQQECNNASSLQFFW